jgi:hypothetical protein
LLRGGEGGGEEEKEEEEIEGMSGVARENNGKDLLPILILTLRAKILLDVEVKMEEAWVSGSGGGERFRDEEQSKVGEGEELRFTLLRE